jgi:hypothetical protein
VMRVLNGLDQFRPSPEVFPKLSFPSLLLSNSGLHNKDWAKVNKY